MHCSLGYPIVWAATCGLILKGLISEEKISLKICIFFNDLPVPCWVKKIFFIFTVEMRDIKKNRPGSYVNASAHEQCLALK